MKTIVLILVIAIGIAISFRAKRERTASETALGRISTEHDALRQNIARERQRLQNARDARAVLPDASRMEAAGSATSGGRELSPEAALANNPPLLTEYLQCLRDTPDWGWGNMFRAVGFSPHQIEQWKEMVVQGVQRRIDHIAAVETQGIGRKSETFKALNAENEELRRAKESEILGDLEPMYREYRSLDGTRSMVQWLTRTAVYSDEPITGDQVERATRILAANTHEVLRTANGQEAPIVNWPAAAGQLKEVLSPAQIATLQTLATQFEKIGRVSKLADDRTKLLTDQFKGQPQH